nr:hypothetical protein BaRGS_004431 [Batillaria attramentaria]
MARKGTSNGDFGDFAQFQTGSVASPTGSQGFADFSQFNSNAATSPTGPAAAGGTAGGELFDVFATPTPAANTSMSVNMTANSQVSMSAGMGMPMMGAPVMGMPGTMAMQGGMSSGMVPQQSNMMSTSGGMAPLTPLTPAASMGWASTQVTTSTVSVTETPVTTPATQKTSPNTWTDSKVDISLDALSPAARQNKAANPSMNQMQPSSPTGMAPGGAGMMRGGMNQGMVSPGMGGGAPQPMMSAGMMGGQGMMGNPA